MRLPTKSKKPGTRNSPKVSIFLSLPAHVITRHLDRLAFDLAQEWSENAKPTTT